ncbi:MAG: hypothetical protein LUQ31_02005 [Methanoregula sp.]|nr:hypothetical protein [Methanoregula sp.]
MEQSQPALSPLFLLVVFMICLSVAGCIAAGIHYFAVDLPKQQEPIELIPDNIVPPYNPCCIAQNATCFAGCADGDTKCTGQCRVQYKTCLRTGNC